MSDSKIRLAIGIPNTGIIKTQTVACLCRMLKFFPHDYILLFKEGSILHWNRETIVKQAIEKKCTHLLFIDSDMTFDSDSATRLLKRNKDIVGVHYNLRKDPPTSTVSMSVEKKMRLKEDHPDGFTTCEAVATGFMLINLNVFKKLKHPWFFWESDEQGEVVTGEDFWFCRLAREAGFEIWVDLSIKMGHIGERIY